MRLISLIFLLPSIANAQLRVAILDTGFDRSLSNAPLCYGRAAEDTHHLKHGTNVADLIYINAGDTGYCLIPIRVVSPELTLADYFEALYLLSKQKIDVLNLSLSGNEYYPTEVRLLKVLLDQGVTIFAAAGNTHHDLTKKCDIYPARDDPRIIIV